MAKRNKETLNMSLSKEDKEYIINQATAKGYKTTSAYLVSCAYNRINVDVDTSHYYDYARQVKAIGYNINALIRDIRTSSYFTAIDISKLEAYLKNIEDTLRKEKNELDKLELEFNKLSNDELKKVLAYHKLEVPIKYIFENILKDISDSLVVFTGYVEQSGYPQMWVDYIYKFMYEELNPSNFDYNKLTELSNEIFLFMQKLSNKLVNPKVKLSEDDYYLLKDIIDKYK